jgi:hypothetical protein
VYLGLEYDPIGGEAPETARWREAAGRVRDEERFLQAIDSGRAMITLNAELKRAHEEIAVLRRGQVKRRRLTGKGRVLRRPS